MFFGIYKCFCSSVIWLLVFFARSSNAISYNLLFVCFVVLPPLLIYNWYVTLCKFKVYKVMICHLYILWNDYHSYISECVYNYTFEWKLKCCFPCSWLHNVMQNMWNALVLRRSVTKKRTETLQSCHVRSQNQFYLIECASIFCHWIFIHYVKKEAATTKGNGHVQDNWGSLMTLGGLAASASKSLHLCDMKPSFSSVHLKIHQLRYFYLVLI